MASPGKSRSWIQRLHPLLQGFPVGVLAGGVLMLVAVEVDMLIAGLEGDRTFSSVLLDTVMTFLLFLQIVCWGMLPSFLAGAILYRVSPKFHRALPYAILAAVAMLALWWSSLTNSKFYPAPGPTLEFAIFAIAFVLASSVFWFVTVRARRKTASLRD